MEDQADQQGIFSKQKINYSPKSEITHLLSSNNQLILAHKNGSIMRIPLQQPEKQTEQEMPRSSSEDRIEHIHLDPSGKHLIISMMNGEVYYLHFSMQKAKNLAKIKGHIITAVGWNHELGRDEETGFILLGTSKGILYETELTSLGQMKYLKQVFSLSESPLVSIDLHRCVSTSNRHCLFLTSPNHLYTFAGTLSQSQLAPFGSSAAHLDPLFLDNKGGGGIRSTEDNDEKAVKSCLCMCNCMGDDVPTYFAWLTAAGIRHGKVDTALDDPDAMTAPHRLLPHPDVNARPDYPIGLALTEFHMLILYRDRMTAVSVLDEQITYEDVIGQKFGNIVGISRDAVSGMIWVFTNKSVLKYRPVDEARYTWKIYLDQGEYLLARQHAIGNRKAFNLVLRKHGEKLIADKKFVAAAEVLSTTDVPFEETALKFVMAQDRNGLKTFLDKKLDQLEPMDKTRRDMLVLWLLDVLLTELSEVKNGLVSGQIGFDQSKYKALREQFRFFVARPLVFETLKASSQSVYQMMNAHGDTDTILLFAGMLHDYETVINLHIQQDQYREALDVLKVQDDDVLFYKFSPILMDQLPNELVEAWICHSARLNLKRLLPALFRCNQRSDKIEAAMRYLDHCLAQNERDETVHNFLVSLYARHSVQKLIAYLKKQGFDRHTVSYDVKFALRICTELKLDEACVHLFCVSELYEEAVTLALKINVDLAKQCANLLNQGENDYSLVVSGKHELRKKVWLKIARHVVEKEQDIEACMELLSESGGVIKIQDLLPFFPQFATIQHFKESLCACLREHSGKIQELQREMKEATDVASEIRSDMATLKSKYTTVRVQDKCGQCREAVMCRPFYAFPCRHFFHNDCILKEISHSLSKESMERLETLKRQLEAALIRSSEYNSENAEREKKQEKQLRMEIDDILASECPWCGHIMISSISQPFFTPSEYLSQLKTWDIR